jgi:Fur family ferric uptake transcriptional regulator
MKTYNTKQRQLILDNMRRMNDKPRTSDEIRRDLQNEGCTVGEATVYRTLALLVEEGSVEKLSFSGRESAAYRYIGDVSELGDSLVLKCLSCGDVTRMECGFSELLGEHLAEDHSFKLDRMKTIVYGTCGRCSGNQGEK